jgi:hypothetical protein
MRRLLKGSNRDYCGGRLTLLVGLRAMFDSGRGSPPAGDLGGVGDSDHGGDQGSSAYATGPGLDAIGAVESGGEAGGSASRILVHDNSCSGNGVESPAPPAPCG